MLRKLPRNYEFKKSVSIIPVDVQTRQPKDLKEARSRVLTLYKDWYREIPVMFYIFNVPLPTQVGRSRLREIFVQNSKIEDLPTIHNLVIKGQMELDEIRHRTKETDHVYKYFRNIDQKKPKDFLSKFLESNN